MHPDDKIGRYKIVSKIGEGGMGEVYLAEDAKLGRLVALKILPARVASDTDRMLRFEHEAKSASALNHPNIITIYEINDEDGALFIAMEYVEGQTLAKKIKSKEFDLRKTLDVATQIAAALSAAHQANVIHRDIKPDNVIVRPDGLVKVLDFGLAKLTEKTPVYDLETLTTLVKTSPGLIMGTVGYMSPEQARGRQVDGRSDIFSFGSMLYEMLSGRRPFTGDNEVDVIASIIHRDQEPLSGVVPGISYELDGIVRKALRKDRDERYQNSRELWADLKEALQKLTSGTGTSREQTTTGDMDQGTITGNGFERPHTTAGQPQFVMGAASGVAPEKANATTPYVAIALALFALAAIGFAGFSWYVPKQHPETFQAMRMSKLTSTGNIVSGQAAVSPDGKYIAYAVQEGSLQSLWLKQTATASNVQIVAAADARYEGIAFSPDIAYIYYSAAEKSGPPTLYQVPVLGGTPRKLISNAIGPVAFSPAGDRIAFIRSETSLMTAKPDGSGEQNVATATEGRRWLRLAWSPDGDKLAASVFSSEDSRDHLVEIRVSDGAERNLSPAKWLRIRGLGWLPDGKGLIVSGRDLDTRLSQLWHVGYTDGEARRITNDLSNYQGSSITADGTAIVSVQENTLSNIWLGRGANAPAQKLTAELGRDEGMSGLSFTPDGSVVYTVSVRGMRDLWIVNATGTDARQLTFDSGSNFSPAVSLDGRYIVFVSTRAGSPDIWRIDIDGGNALRLTDDPGSEAEPALTPDGKWVVYQLADSDNRSTIQKVSIDGGAPVQVTDVQSERPAISADGRFIACFLDGGPGTSQKTAIASIDGGAPVKILDFPLVARSRTVRWSPDGSSLIYFDSRETVYNLWSQPLNGGPPKQLTDFSSDRIFRFDVTRDGKNYALARGTETSDAVMVTDFR